MNTVLIAGAAGKMGQAIAYAMKKLGFGVLVADSNSEALISFCSQNPEFTPIHINAGMLAKPDIVISAAPYDQNEGIAALCFQNGVKYCDLGGYPEYSSRIHNIAKSQCFTDLGLAPGLVNFIAEEIYSKMPQAHTINLYVGGLPKEPGNGWLKYAEVWSLKGLYANYKGMCDVIENGQSTHVKALSGHEKINDKYEAFHTMGGLSSTLELMKNRGVRNCSYKTIRYLGHACCAKFLLDECKMTEQEFEMTMRRACPPTPDSVLIMVEALSDFDKYSKKLRISCDHRFSAMQRSTAFPISAVAAMMSRNEISSNNMVLNYADVSLSCFYATLDQIDSNFFETFL
jgi:saccharopine dehydrogenase-like NADP-dependent oxidoreductase